MFSQQQQQPQQPGYPDQSQHVPNPAYYNQPPPYVQGQPSVYPGGPSDYPGQNQAYGPPQPFGGQPQPFGGQPQPFGGQPDPHAAMKSFIQSEQISFRGQQPDAELQGFSEKSVRRAFIRKVYGILMCQLLLTAAIMAVFMFVAEVKT